MYQLSHRGSLITNVTLTVNPSRVNGCKNMGGGRAHMCIRDWSQVLCSGYTLALYKNFKILRQSITKLPKQDSDLWSYVGLVVVRTKCSILLLKRNLQHNAHCIS